MTPPLTMVISWLMEYSLRYDLPQLKSELKDLFPNLVVLDKLEIPDKKTLVDLATLRLIVNRCLIKHVNTLRPVQFLTLRRASDFGRGGGASGSKRHLLRSILLIRNQWLLLTE